jgi:orotate phosphoribosyltransferase
MTDTALPYGYPETPLTQDEMMPSPWPGKGKPCQCNICAYSRKVSAVIATRDADQLIGVVNELMNATYNMGEDLSYTQCVLNGSWPSSVRQLEEALEKAKNHPNRKLDDERHLPPLTTDAGGLQPHDVTVQCKHMTDKNNLLRYLFGIGAIKKGKFVLKSGKETDIYCDARLAALDATGLALAATCFDNLLVPYEYDCIGVMEGAGSSVLLGGLLLHTGEGGGFIVRKEAKQYGSDTKGMVVGNIGKHCVLLDDVATSGKSLVHAVTHMPVKPLCAAVLIDRQEGAAEALQPYGVPLISVATLQEVRDFDPHAPRMALQRA